MPACGPSRTSSTRCARSVTATRGSRAALARPDVVVQIILDHIHLAAGAAKVVWNAAAGRVALVTDAVAGAGLNDGSYTLGGFEVKIRDGVTRDRTACLPEAL